MTVTTATLGASKTIPADSFGLNGGDVKSHINSWNNASFLAALDALAPPLLRYAAGTTANTWRWRRSAIDGTFAGYTEGGANDPDTGLPYALTLVRFAEICIAVGATPIFDLNVDCDSTVYGTVDNDFAPKPYANPNLIDQLEMLAAAAAIGLPVALVELGNEFYLANQPEKTTYPNPVQAKTLLDGAGDPLYTNTPGGFPLGMVWDYAALSVSNANGQDEIAMMRGHAVTGYPEAVDVPGTGAAGGGFLYGKRCAQWMAAIRAAHPGVKIAVHAAPGPSSLPSLGAVQRRYFNQGLVEALNVGVVPANTPDAVVLHTYWDSGLTYTYGNPVPSIDRAGPGGSQANLDTYLSRPTVRWTQIKGLNLGSIASGSVPGNTGTDPFPYYTIKSLIDAGAKVWVTEYNLLDAVSLSATANASQGAEHTHGGWGQVLEVLAAGLTMYADPSVERLLVHTGVGSSAALVSIFAKTTAYRASTLTTNGLLTRTVVDGVLALGTALLSSLTAAFTADDEGATVTVGDFTTTILSVQDPQNAVLADVAPIDGLALTVTIDPLVAYPQYRLAGAGTPNPQWGRGVTGQAALALGQAARGATAVRPLVFSGTPLIGTTVAPGLLGALFTGPSGKVSAVIVNLRSDAADVTLPTELAAKNYVLAAADPADTTLTAADLATHSASTTGAGTPLLTIPAYGMVRFDAVLSPAALLASFDPPVSATASEMVQYPTEIQAEELATTAASDALADAIPKTVIGAKGSIPIGSAPGVAHDFALGGAPADSTLKVDPTTVTGWALGKIPLGGLSESSRALSPRHSATGAISAGNINTGKFTDTAAAWFLAADAANGAIITINAVGNVLSGSAPPAGSTYVVATYTSATVVVLNPGGSNPGPDMHTSGFTGNQIDYTIAVPNTAHMEFDTTSGLWLPKVPAALAVAPNSNFLSSDYNHSAWVCDPILATASGTMIAGTLYVARVKAENAIPVAALYFGLTSATTPAGLVGVFAAAFAADGLTRHLVSTDRSADVIAVAGTNAKVRLQFSSNLALTPGTHYYAALLCVTAGTMMTVQRVATNGLSVLINDLPLGTVRYKTLVGQASMPNTITPTSGGVASGVPWMALGA